MFVGSQFFALAQMRAALSGSRDSVILTVLSHTSLEKLKGKGFGLLEVSRHKGKEDGKAESLGGCGKMEAVLESRS